MPAPLQFGFGLLSDPAAAPSSYSRTQTASSFATASTAAGVYSQFGANVPRVTSQGLLIEAARTNKVLVNSANPVALTGMTKSGDAAAVLSLVSDTAALAAAGLSGVVTGGQVWKLDNSLGTTTAIATASGGVGNINPHSVSAFVRGTGTGVRVRLNSVGAAAAPPTAGYTRVQTPNLTPLGTGNGWTLWLDAGAVAWFILPQLEEGPAGTSPIVNPGVAASRGADLLTLTVPTDATQIYIDWGTGSRTTVSVASLGGATTFSYGGDSGRPWVGSYVQQVSFNIIGTSAVTEAADTGAAVGKLTVSGSATLTEASDTAAAAGGLLISGDADLSEGEDLGAAAAVLPIRASLASTEDDDTLAAELLRRIKATLSDTEDDDTGLSTSLLLIRGALAATEDGDSLFAYGLEGDISTPDARTQKVAAYDRVGRVEADDRTGQAREH